MFGKKKEKVCKKCGHLFFWDGHWFSKGEERRVGFFSGGIPRQSWKEYYCSQCLPVWEMKEDGHNENPDKYFKSFEVAENGDLIKKTKRNSIKRSNR